jgi:photosystem II stability/assembly factor-like uncharacterized protein
VVRVHLRLERLEERTLLAHWAPVGPAPIYNGNVPGSLPVTGRITALAAHPTDRATIYIAAGGGGVWKTTDGGADWTPLTDDQATLFMGAIALAPSNPNIIYAGTGEADGPSVNFLANYSPTVFYGRGVLKSTNAGATWTLLGNDVFDRRSIGRIVVDPTNPDIVYAAVSQAGFNGLAGNEGIWKSTDGGTTWTNTTAESGLPSTTAFTDVVMDPSNNQHLFAAIGDPNGNTADGLYETTDGGATWALSNSNFPTGSRIRRITLAISPTDPLRMYAAITNATGGLFRLLRTDDGGASWVNTLAPNYLGGQGGYDTTLAVDPHDPDRVFAGGQGGPIGVIESTDAGATFTGIAVGASGMDGPHNDHHGIGFDATGRLLDGTDAGLWRLENPDPNQIRWSDLNGNLQITTFIGIALHPTDPNIAYGASQDTGAEKYTGSPAWTQVRPNDGGYIRVDPAHPNTVYYENFGISLQRSDDGGLTWADKITGISGSSNFYVPYVLDPSQPTRLVLGTNSVFETTDRGDDWVQLSAPNSRGWTVSSPIDSVAVAPGVPDTIYASPGGHIFVTTDHGATWSQRDIPGYTDHFFDLEVDPADSQTAYAVRGVFDGGHVFRTSNGGLDWTDISGNLPNLPMYTLAMVQGYLLVGTDAGVYFSHDGGQSWRHLGQGLPNAQVKELVVNPDLRVVAAGTHGRGMWELFVPGVFGAEPDSVALPISGATLAHQPVSTAGTVLFPNSAEAQQPASFLAAAAAGNAMNLEWTQLATQRPTAITGKTMAATALVARTEGAASPGSAGMDPLFAVLGPELVLEVI